MIAAPFLVSALVLPALRLDVPHVAQPENGCGPASIAMVLQYWSRHAAVSAPPLALIHREVYSDRLKGALASRMRAFFEEHGFHAFAFEGRQQDLEENLRKGRPIIVALKTGGARLHVCVLTGLDPERVYLNDPAFGKDHPLDRSRFEKQWAAAGRWMLVAAPRSAP